MYDGAWDVNYDLTDDFDSGRLERQYLASVT
jgi:hypothetical protein